MASSEKRPKCKYHQTETITHYCCQVGCFSQLCAACICDHTQAHNVINTKPKYQLVKQVHANTHNSLVKLKELVVEQKNRMSLMVERINKQKQQGFNILKQAKEDILQLVHRTFEDIQDNYARYTEQQKSKTGFYTPTRLNYLYSELNNYNLEIYNKCQQLTTGISSKIISNIHTDFIPLLHRNIDNIDRELTEHGKFGVGLAYRHGSLEQVASVIKKLFTTSVSYSLPSHSKTERSLSRPRQACLNINVRATNPLTSTRQNSTRKSNTFIKTTGMECKSPRVDGNRYGLASTAKQNYYAMGTTDQFKMFPNSYS